MYRIEDLYENRDSIHNRGHKQIGLIISHTNFYRGKQVSWSHTWGQIVMNLSSFTLFLAWLQALSLAKVK